MELLVHFIRRWRTQLPTRSPLTQNCSFCPPLGRAALQTWCFQKTPLHQKDSSRNTEMCVIHTQNVHLSYLCSHIMSCELHSECVKRKAVYQHGSLVVAACHPCRPLTLFLASLPRVGCLIRMHETWQDLHRYLAPSPLWCTVCGMDYFCGLEPAGERSSSSLQNTQTEYSHMHRYKCTHTFLNMHTFIHEHRRRWQTHLLMYSWASAPSLEMIYF